MNPTESVIKSAGAILAEMELTINAPRQTVWDAFVNDSSDWWHKDFYTSKGPAKFVIDPKIGGHMYEDAGGGAGLIWFTILGLVPGEMFYVFGHMRPPYGGPAIALITFTFEEKSESETVFKVSDATFGHVTENLAESAESGWKMLFAELKTFIEGK